MCFCVIDIKVCSALYLSEIQEETGILSSLRQIGQEDCDADQENRGVLAHLTQGLWTKKSQREHEKGGGRHWERMSGQEHSSMIHLISDRRHLRHSSSNACSCFFFLPKMEFTMVLIWGNKANRVGTCKTTFLSTFKICYNSNDNNKSNINVTYMYTII